jgi:hypothetical protein
MHSGDLCHVPQGVYLYRTDRNKHFSKRTVKPKVGVYIGESFDERHALIFLEGQKFAVRKSNIYKLKEEKCW